MNHEKNLLRIKAIHGALGPLQNEVVFVGGATVSLYLDRMAEEVRETEDIDSVVDIWTHGDYAVFEEKPRNIGFLNDQASRVICRYRYFIASKIDAFRERGGNDGRQSADFEDIVFIFENRRAVWEDMETCPADMRDYLKLDSADFWICPISKNGLTPTFPSDPHRQPN